jgi:UDP-N-acetylmuramoyl-tripeptide--D-alanyl-D-alanine ligase
MSVRAQAAIRKYKPHILIVCGGVGKTLAKDAAYAALSSRFYVRRTEKAYNADIGVPLAVLGVPSGGANPFLWLKSYLVAWILEFLPAPYPKWLVLEVGADRPGEVTDSLSWLAADIVIATRFPTMPSHVEFYDSPEAVIAEEFAPVGWLKPRGILVRSADETDLKIGPPPGAREITYGFSKGAGVTAQRLRLLSKGGMASGISFDVISGEERAHVSLSGLIGKQHVLAVLAGVAAGISAGIPLAETVKAYEAFTAAPGRMRIIPGMRGSVLLDDTYNASPIATEEALETLNDAPRKGKRIALLADMLELGSYSVDAHAKVGTIAAKKADVLITVGVRARGIAEHARREGMQNGSVFECETPADAAAKAVSVIEEGDVVLIKGSRALHMERVVKSLMADPTQAKKLLVRQGGE